MRASDVLQWVKREALKSGWTGGSYSINLLSGLDETPRIDGSWSSPRQRRGMNEVSLICLVHGGFSVTPGFPMAKTETTFPRKLSLMVL